MNSTVALHCTVVPALLEISYFAFPYLMTAIRLFYLRFAKQCVENSYNIMILCTKRLFIDLILMTKNIDDLFSISGGGGVSKRFSP